MGKKIQMVGKRFGYLVVTREAPRSAHGIAMWICKCDCGNVTKPIRSGDLRFGKVQSCGCLHKRQLSDMVKKHGLKHTRLYSIWQNMKNRCRNANVPCYATYGGRGISVCDEWKDNFQAFYDWAMESGYSDDLTIDRIDVNGNYCPENCRWMTQKDQSNNLRKNVIVEIESEKHTLSEWSRISGVRYTTLYQRYLRGWTGLRLLQKADTASTKNKGSEGVG